MPNPTPEITRPPGAPWRIHDVAEHFGISPSTVRGYKARGQMPEPDGTDQYGPWWLENTITGWQRPGQGNRTGPRGHRSKAAKKDS